MFAGASATEQILEKFVGKPVRAFIVWEPVLLTDWSSPSTAALRRISDPRVSQYWDKHRIISHEIGEHDRRSIIWDHIAVYPPETSWRDLPPKAVYEGGPVVYVTVQARTAVRQALGQAAPGPQH